MARAVEKLALGLLVIVTHQVLSAFHSLQYVITGTTSGKDFLEYTVVGLVDGKQFVYYDSNIRKMIPKTEWMEKNVGEDYWSSETEKQGRGQEIFRADLDILMKRFNQTEGIHTLQRRSGCELDDDDGSVKGYFQFGYDGEDFLSLDTKTLTWTAANQKAVTTKLKWETEGDAQYRKDYLENDCGVYLRKYVEYGRSTLERKVPPEVYLFQRDSSSPVLCHATGFYPKSVNISWQKNEEDLDEDVEIRETLPNQDGTFQKRSILTVSPEELNKQNYTCIVQHNGLKYEMRVPRESVPRVLSEGGVSVVVIVGVVVAVILLVLLTGGAVFIWKKKMNDSTSVL